MPHLNVIYKSKDWERVNSFVAKHDLETFLWRTGVALMNREPVDHVELEVYNLSDDVELIHLSAQLKEHFSEEVLNAKKDIMFTKYFVDAQEQTKNLIIFELYQ